MQEQNEHPEPYLNVINRLEQLRLKKAQYNAKYNNKMKELHKDDDPLVCPICYGKYYPVNKTHHYKTDKHKNGLKIRAEVYGGAT
jgi:hypothetical protein